MSPLAMPGSQAVPVVMTAWSWRSRLPATATRAWVLVSLLSARPVRCACRAASTGLLRNAAHTARQAARRSWGRPRPLIPVLPW